MHPELSNITQLDGIMYRIQTDARVITGNKDRDKKPRPQAEVFYFEVFISCNHEGEVCILFKYMPMKTDFLQLFSRFFSIR